MEGRNMEMARRVAAAVREAGGRSFYVGGYVRDALLGLENKDIDIEVHGISAAALEAILDRLGERLTMGASFGIMGLRGYALDIAMPRSEKATGRGHKDFAVFVDPFLGEEKAATRRDFTMNALMQDILTGEILDFFGGREDLARGLIRHVNDRTYLEDPLRVLRAAQFAARFGFTVAEETAALSSGADLTALPGERVMGELEKALLKARRPSIFFEQLRKMKQLPVWFPEPEALIGLPHPEGGVWTHTMRVLDTAAGLREDAEHPLWFMLAALCHDFGAAVTAREPGGMLHANGHEAEALAPVRQFLLRLTREAKLTQYVLNMAELHTKPNELARMGASAERFMELFDRAVCPGDLLLLARADDEGGIGPEAARRQGEMLAEYRERMSRPCVMGHDLIEAGARPGPLFTGALECAHRLRLAGRPKEEQLMKALAWLRDAEED